MVFRMETTIKTIKEIFEDPFFSKGFEIPYYQRGYRWRDENIKDLILDINQENEGYCLQPIVINTGGGVLPQIVDGQQRLTTISLIRKELGSNDALIFDSLRSVDRNNIDNDFLEKAEETITNVINENKIDRDELRSKLEKCLFIVCTINADDKEAENVFIRLNVGKIPLSSAEIFKSYCLTEYEEACKDTNFIEAWNTIESALQNDDFYHFFSHDDKNKCVRYYSTRMDWLLEVFAIVYLNSSEKHIKEEFEKNPNFIFNELYQWIKGGNEPERFIKGLKCIFDKLQQIYSDIESYNLFGYLSCYPGQGSVLSLCAEVTKEGLSGRLRTSGSFGKEDLKKLLYGVNSDELKKVLLLHNAIKSIDRNIRFDYNAYRNGEYDLEHIHARAELKTPEDVKKFLKAVKEEFGNGSTWNSNKEYFEEFEKFCNDYADIRPNDEVLLKQYENCIWALQAGGEIKKEGDRWYGKMPDGLESPDEWRMTSIRNLCLLQSSINKSISNYGFSEKRRRVTTQIYSSRSELPVTTAMIFNVVCPNDYHTENAALWTRQMGDAYLDDIASTIEKEG